MKVAIILVMLFVHGIVNSASLSTEDIFSQAEKYTLELKTEIKISFVGDEVGSYSGTGFLIDKKRGWLLTNAHVVGRSPSVVTGRFKDAEYHGLTKLYVDPVIDLAVLQIDPATIQSNAVEARLDCESTPRTGHPIGAYGHPWGLSFVATRGIVSGMTNLDDDEWLQVDAPINSGNSGGALISLKTGLVVGINSAVVKEAEGLNFALPLKHVCTVVKILQDNKDPSPPELNVSFFQSDDKKQLKVANVYGDSSLQSGDIIQSVSGNSINHRYGFINSLRGKKEAKVSIVRNGKVRIITLLLKPSLLVLDDIGIYFSGMLITPNNLLDVKSVNLNNSWVINSVEAGSTAESQELVVWDFVTTIDGKKFSDIKKLFSYLKTKNDNDVSLVLKRLSDAGSRYFDYHQIDVKVNGLRMIEIN